LAVPLSCGFKIRSLRLHHSSNILKQIIWTRQEKKKLMMEGIPIKSKIEMLNLPEERSSKRICH
jgi:hypothetical protein